LRAVYVECVNFPDGEIIWLRSPSWKLFTCQTKRRLAQRCYVIIFSSVLWTFSVTYLSLSRCSVIFLLKMCEKRRVVSHRTSLILIHCVHLCAPVYTSMHFYTCPSRHQQHVCASERNLHTLIKLSPRSSCNNDLANSYDVGTR